MAVRSQEEMFEMVRNRIGDDTSDEALAFVEDFTDTMKDMESKAKGANDLQKKLDENDKMWREKMRDRFFSSDASAAKDDNPNQEQDPEQKPLTFENLFS